MQAAKSFIDILAHELRKEIRAEVEADLAASSRESVAARIESSHKAESVELWLNLKMGGAFAGHGANRASAYQSSRKQSKPSASTAKVLQLPTQTAASQEIGERTGKAVTIEQTFALEFFKREGSKFSSVFSETELKSEFRKIALRIHPDRHAGASVEQLRALSARFQTLVESAEVLEATLS